MRERGVVRSIGESINPGRMFAALVLGLAAGVATAIVFMALIFNGTSAGQFMLSVGACYLGALLLAWYIARYLRTNTWLAAGVMLVAWPPIAVLVWIVTFFLTWDPQ